MLHELLKIVTYLSILTSSTSYSSHLSRESYLNNQRASPYSSFPNEQLTDDYVPNVDGEEVDRWIGYENSMDPRGSSSSDYLIPRHFNVNENPLGIGSGGNNRFSSRKPQSYKKSAAKNSRFNSMKMQQNSRSQSQEPYTLRKKSTAKLGLSNSQTSNKNATEDIQSFEKKMNKTTISPSNLSSYNSNEYPNSQQSTISLSKDQELQQLFGVENAQIYKKHQKQLKSSSDDVNLPQLKNSNDATDIKDSQKKRNNGENEQLPEMSSFTSNHLMRATRRQREYDVPLIQCPPATDGMERFACPTPDRQGRYRCIDDHVLCDGFIDCPEGADEDRQNCMFYKTTKAHLDVLADALLRWARGR